VGHYNIKHPCNLLYYWLDRTEHFIVRESKNHHPKAFEELLSDSIFLRCIVVDWTIYLNDEARFNTKEIKDEFTHGVLTPKLEVYYLPTAQMLP
jgi:hypothetical protein